MADSTATKSTTAGHENHWSTTANKSGTYEFKTAGKYVDRNIDLVIPAATSSSTTGTVTATAGTTSVSGMETSETNTGFSVTATGGSVTTTKTEVSVGVGFVDSTITKTVNGETKNGSSSTTYIKAQTTGTSNTGTKASSITPSVSNTQYVNISTGYQNTAKYWEIKPMSAGTAATLNASGSGSATIDTVTIGSASGGNYPITGSAEISGTASATVGTAGYASASLTGSGNVSGTATLNANIPAGSFANSAAEGKTYTEDASAATVIPANGALYINEGWYPDTKITLSHIIPDPEGGKDNPGTNDLRSGTVAYDGEGNQIVGTMADAVASVAKPTVASESIAVTKGTGSVTSIAGTPVTTAPSSGNYITLKPKYTATASNGSRSVTTAGYLGSSAQIGTAGTTSLSKETTYYIPITSAATPALSITDSTSTITPSAISGNSSYYDITTSVTGKTTYTTAGYVSTSGLDAATDSSATVGRIAAGTITNGYTGTGTSSGTIGAGAKIKISKGWYPSDIYYTAQDASSTGEAVFSLSGTASGFTASQATTSYYVTPNHTVTTAGYLSGSITPSSANKIYIPTTTITGNLSVTSSSTSYAAPSLVSDAPSGAYITITGSGTGAGTGMVSSSVSGSSVKYMSIYEGIYSIS